MLPSKIKLLEKEFEIRLVDTIEDVKDGYIGLGEIKDWEEIISLKRDLPKVTQHMNLLHEVVHGIFRQTGHSNYDQDEDLIECLALGIYSLIKHNDFSFMKDEYIEEKNKVECTTFGDSEPVWIDDEDVTNGTI